MKSALIRFFNRFILGKITIGTHNGKFHCDEVLACAMLTNYTKTFKGATIERTRNLQRLALCHVVVDVGGKYKPPRLLDHHQIEFDSVYPGFKIRMSSSGLVYLHHPEIIPNIIKQILEKEKDRLPPSIQYNSYIEKEVRRSIYRNLIMYVDANDNGIFKINENSISLPTTLWRRVSQLNPMWWEDSNPEREMEQFHKAIHIAKQELYSLVRSTFLGSIQTKKQIEEAFNSREKISPNGKIIVLSKYLPWHSTLQQILMQKQLNHQQHFVICQSKDKSQWRIHKVYNDKQGLKKEWRGVMDKQKLRQISGISDINFVHAAGFMGSAKTIQGAIKMGQLSLIENEPAQQQVEAQIENTEALNQEIKK